MKTWMGVAIACTCSIVSVYCLSSTNSIQLSTQTCKRWWTSFVAALQQCRDGNVIGLIGIGQAGYIVAFTIFYIFSDYISHHIFRLPSSSPKCACFIGSLDMSKLHWMLPPNKGLVLKCGACPWRFWSNDWCLAHAMQEDITEVCKQKQEALSSPTLTLRCCSALGWLLKACCSTSLILRLLLHLDSPRQCFWPRSFKTLFILQAP